MSLLEVEELISPLNSSSCQLDSLTVGPQSLHRQQLIVYRLRPIQFSKCSSSTSPDETCTPPSLVLNYFRPISNLRFLSEVLEKSVASWLISQMNNSNMSEHSTEAALIQVTNDLLLKSTFDTIDHVILINRPEDCVGIKDTGLARFCSFLSDRSFSGEGVILTLCSSDW